MDRSYDRLMRYNSRLVLLSSLRGPTLAKFREILNFRVPKNVLFVLTS